MSPTPAVPRFTRKYINDMQDQLLSMNLEKEGLDFTGKGKEMRKRLLDHFYPTSHSDVLYPGSDPGSTPLHDAAPVDTNLASDPGFTPLHVAAPVDTNPPSDSGITPLHDAVSVDTNPASDLGSTPLHDAASVDTNPASDSGLTPLHVAAPTLSQEEVKGLKVDKLRLVSMELGLPTVDNVTKRNLLKPALRDQVLNHINFLEANQKVPSLERPDEPWFQGLPRTGSVIKRVPKAARLNGSRILTDLLERIIATPDSKEAWEKYYQFAYTCLKTPPRAGKKNTSLATVLNKRLDIFEKGGVFPKPPVSKKKSAPSLSTQVASKLGIGDVKGAVRLCTSKDVVLQPTPDVIKKLKEKHPSRYEDSNIPPYEEGDNYVCDVSEVKDAIRSFPNGSGGGPDGLLPQHIKDFTEESLGPQADKLLDTLVNFMNLIVFAGKIPTQACPVFFGAKLIALSKEDNGVRPIAVGWTLRRVAAKILMGKLGTECVDLFWPNQVGVGTPLGAEMAIHSVRKFLSSPTNSNMVCLKTDFSNAFNTLRRDKALEDIKLKVPLLYKYAWQAYANPSCLFLGEKDVIMSEEGVQQGDPLGPFFYALSSMAITRNLKSPLKVFYLDDAFIAGDPVSVREDFDSIKEVSKSLGLLLNPSKCELFSINPSQEVMSEFPGVKEISAADLKLLGAPILQEAFEDVLHSKLENLKTMVERLKQLDSHDALFLLKQCFAIPKIMYTLRTAPCFLNIEWCKEFDDTLRKALQRILNVNMDDSMWDQCSLPVSLGGIGVRRASDVAVPAYLSSVHATGNGVQAMVSDTIFNESNSFFDLAKEIWLAKVGTETPLPSNQSCQKQWDLPLSKKRFDDLFSAATTEKDRARLLAVSSKNSSDWLNAFPIPSMGLKLDDNTLKISCALRLGATICQPHKCTRCGNDVDQTGTHGLSCNRQVGRHPRHNRINYIIKRALGVVGFNSRIEPKNLSTAEDAQGLVPDGVTQQTYRNGKCMIWDYTCHDTYADTYLNVRKWSGRRAGKVAEEAEKDKVKKYAPMSRDFYMVPICVETTGVWGPSGYKFIKELGRLTIEKTKEKRSTSFIMQNISMEIQRGNCASVLCTIASPKLLNELFELFKAKDFD